MKNKVLVLGLDGCTFDLLDPWMEKGFLPNLKKIKVEGTTGRLRSTYPPVTGPAWVSFMTGKNPGKHSIYEFLVRKPGSYGEFPVNADNRDGQTLWEILSTQGYRVAVLNVPMTYPPQKVNGVLISDFLTPAGKRDFTHPPELLDEIEEKFGRYYLHQRTIEAAIFTSDNYIATFLEDCLDMMRYKCAVAKYLMSKEDYNFFMLHIVATDRVQHTLWNILDPNHPHYRADLAGRYYDKVVSFYRELDKQLGEIIGTFDSSGTVFIISDHGFCTVNHTIDLNAWLLQEGYIRLKGGFFTRLKYFLWKRGLTYEWLFGRLGMAWGKLWARILGKYWEKLLAAMAKSKFAKSPMNFVTNLILHKSVWLLSLKDVDWSQTRAYCKTGQGQIFINLKGRDPQGTVNGGKEYEELQQEIIERFRRLMNGLTGGKSQAEIYARQEIYSGTYFDEMPDITVIANRDGYQAGSFVDFGSNRTVSDLTLLTGNHDMHGIFLAKGESVNKGSSISGANLIDVAPTVLHVMGCKVPKDMDGRVLTGIFEEGFIERHPVAFIEAAVSAKEVRSEMSPEDQKQVLEQLRSLGYID
jgi:predicted AlkP superfamily phosphohydrolase/phosphomutase